MNRPFVRAMALSRPVPADSYIAALPAVRWLQGAGALSFPNAVTLFCFVQFFGRQEQLGNNIQLPALFDDNATGG